MLQTPDARRLTPEVRVGDRYGSTETAALTTVAIAVTGVLTCSQLRSRYRWIRYSAARPVTLDFDVGDWSLEWNGNCLALSLQSVPRPTRNAQVGGHIVSAILIS